MGYAVLRDPQSVGETVTGEHYVLQLICFLENKSNRTTIKTLLMNSEREFSFG